FHTATGVLDGTPMQGGNFSITVTATDSNGCQGVGALYRFTITCPTITVTHPANSSGTAGVAFSEQFSQTGAVGTLPFSETGALPSGLTFHTATGILDGTTNQVGVFPITVTATDQNGCQGTGSTDNLTINCQTITVNNAVVSTGTACAAFSQQFTATGILGTPAFSLASGSLPAGMTLHADGTLDGTPTVTGNFPITVTVTDTNTCSATGATYNLTIGCPTITVTNPGVTTGTVDAPFSQQFTQSGACGTATFSLNSGSAPPGKAQHAVGDICGTV